MGTLQCSALFSNFRHSRAAGFVPEVAAAVVVVVVAQRRRRIFKMITSRKVSTEIEDQWQSFTHSLHPVSLTSSF